MPLIIPPDYALATWEFSGAPGTAPFATTCGFRVDGWLDSQVAAANHLFTAYQLSWLLNTDSEITLDRVTLLIGDLNGNGSVESDLSPEAGQTATADGPISMAVIMRKTTDQLGRKGRGRCFIPGVLGTEDVNQDGTIKTASLAVFQATADDFHDNVTSPGGAPTGALEPVLLHNDPALAPTVISNFTVTPLVGWIRGRIR